MVLLIVMVYLMISGSCGADMFDSLNEAQVNGGKAMACVSDTYKNTLRSCQGVIWRQSSLLVRASCLKYARDPYVQKGITNCTRSNSTTTIFTEEYCDDDMCIRHVIAIYMHPRFPTIDLAILRLDAPYSSETHALNGDLEQKLNEWETFIVDYYTTATATGGTIQIRHNQMYTTPVKMILITVILPTASFVLFFLYVIFYTGSSDKNVDKDIQYTSLTNEEFQSKMI
ncbi:jg22320 [Pararge aegeria aegeria]|uniref:Jg22320 protein n=1 Tax=Pararge aegeria aegeria TaxID=348720 RepID=A0A8S4SF94_9NEOP|nr:jg22320 [Pararge aegeria aegeria]